MKSIWKVLPGLVFAAFLVLPSSVSADTLVQSDVVTVRATVLPARYIIVDSQGVITSIISNTFEDVTPAVYLGSVATENAQPLTPQLLGNYNQLMGTIRVTGPGVLYKRTQGQKPTQKTAAPPKQSNVIHFLAKKSSSQ